MTPSIASALGPTSKSGIAETEDGHRHIPSSVRADGSVRREIRVRDGYRPPEDVEVYKNRSAESWKNRGKGGIPGAEAIASEPVSSAANKNAKRREARKKAAAASTEVQGASNGADKQAPSSGNGAIEAIEPVDPEVEKAKEARKLSKKLRQARELKDKKEKGDSLLPEQLEKVIKINELIRQLDKLGFDIDGEKKTEPA
ncbi:Partner of Y14 and mago [Sphaceloma murrayae]|uniref:Partner of Y14 and mago n=1 Tax=Sphaceloma murrayae TaxID=2082308 RepID=A0A2K1QHG2_9PEZI|nr:Partner of Y14 and mago [Sphaceloma murrayae]